MLTMTAPPRTTTPRYTLHDFARALGIILHKEIGVPFMLYDAGTGTLVAMSEGPAFEDLPPLAALTPAEVQQLVEHGHAEVRVVAPGAYQLSLVLFQANRPALVAAAAFAGLARTEDDAERERTWLAQWVYSVSERLRLSEQVMSQKNHGDDNASQNKSAWEGLMALDHVIRRLRLHKEPIKNLERIVQTAFDLSPAQSLICVPPLPAAEPFIVGERLLCLEDCRALSEALARSPECREDEPLFVHHSDNPPWGRHFPAIHSLLAFPLQSAAPRGWLIAVNQVNVSDTPGGARARAFRRSDAALLLPFVALMRLQCTAGGRYQELKELVVGLARSLTAAIDAKDAYTYGHSERVARIALEIGTAMELGGDELSDLYLVGLLHDVGKIGVPDEVLRKKEPLTPDEYEIVKQHVNIGYAILSDLRPIRHLLCGVLHHHEHWDGTGYPERLKGEKIPQIARILAVADAYDAMSTDRPYRTALPTAQVEQRLQEGVGAQWDERVIAAFMKCKHKIHAIRQRGVGESLRQALDCALRSKGSTNVL